MHVACVSSAWFIFNLNAQFCYLQIIYYNIYTLSKAHFNPPFLLLFTPLLLIWGTSLLVVQIPIHSCPWSANNRPTLCQFSYPFTPHISSYTIYIDAINNTSLPRRAHKILFTFISYTQLHL
jgi:hypothetical protein